ncbi:unnamed protein product [Anisakis simplex]|uniref:BHLH domain-containing protein n=1 Tax=Anisakis simplex TaxID=6269 RepID=A0A0M3JRD1_ANISI|nr:unnamed protein product [Anisakis simplex]
MPWAISQGTASSLLSMEEIEPYVRRKRLNSDKASKLDSLNEEEQSVLRMSINSRERKRMHDLNDALEELRQCLPYSQTANSRKMSKINTLLLASNWIRQLTNTNNELRRQLEELRSRTSSLSLPLSTSSSARASDCNGTRAPIVWPSSTSATVLPSLTSSRNIHSLALINNADSNNNNNGVFPLNFIHDTHKSMLKITSSQRPCIKALNSFCFCVKCIVKNSSHLKGTHSE